MAFCPPEFTIAQLRAVYEAVWGVPVDPRNFHRKITGAAGFVEPTGVWRATAGAPPSCSVADRSVSCSRPSPAPSAERPGRRTAGQRIRRMRADADAAARGIRFC
ncbi:NrtR DNA-binding winged helix domain-containing protein [Microbacterium laevaniformans]|uniref:NrtR DNA-binding winged helix domain-containing protein n=1 Tax=Microbacterium laevaniformans TaxID=36807 RepID=UPI003CD06BD4